MKLVIHIDLAAGRLAITHGGKQARELDWVLTCVKSAILLEMLINGDCVGSLYDSASGVVGEWRLED